MVSLVVGPMGSGKSKILIDYYNVTSLTKNVQAFKPATDTRSSFISSRNGQKIKADSVKSFSDILNKLKNDYPDTYAILVDEVQFLDFEGFLKLYEYVMRNNLELVLGGLNLTSEMKPFNTVKEIMPYCNDIFSYSTTCKCGKQAYYSKCLVKKNQEVLIGADELYSATCYKCFKEE